MPEENISHPSHYCSGMECKDEIILIYGREVWEHFCIGNIHKYRKRAMLKNGEEDLKKADQYVQFLEESKKCRNGKS